MLVRDCASVKITVRKKSQVRLSIVSPSLSLFTMAEVSTPSGSSGRTTWKRKRQLLSKIQAMAAAKRAACSTPTSVEEPHSTEGPALSPPAPESELDAPGSTMEASTVDHDYLISENSKHKDSNDDKLEFDESKAQEI